MVKCYNYKQLKLNYGEIKYKKVIIWCCSLSGLSMYKELEHAGIEVIGFADSARMEQQGSMFAGLPVFTFEELKLYLFLLALFLPPKTKGLFLLFCLSDGISCIPYFHHLKLSLFLCLIIILDNTVYVQFVFSLLINKPQ